ncbi:hypothetical protein ACFQVC_22955 [Streptomyces monticola]|uniref:Uncharacterized protein n=1 Tax=Streptomyces monticola TaxID=2666263 RepID=A0ABW2JP04_9ACTN
MQRKTTTTTTRGRRRAQRLAVAVAATGVLVGGGVLSAGSAGAATFCGETPAGGYACIIGQEDGSFNYYNSDGEIVYNW